MAKQIQWFPGHMAKTLREIKENLKLVDMSFELIDARIPRSSFNPQLDELLTRKPKLLIMTKTDLVNPQILKQWLSFYREKGYHVLALDTRNQKSPQLIAKKVQSILADQALSQQEKGIQKNSTRVLLAGIPNVGKSTLLNHLAAKKMAQTANRPGVTRKVNWLKTSVGLELLDTPGVLWPKFENQAIGYRLAISGAIKDTLYAPDDAALFLIDIIKRQGRMAQLQDRYHLDDASMQQEGPFLLLDITKKLGFKEDYDRAAIRMINDYRNQKLGDFILDEIEDA